MGEALKQLNVVVPETLRQQLVTLCRANRVPVRHVVIELIRRLLQARGIKPEGESEAIADCGLRMGLQGAVRDIASTP